MANIKSHEYLRTDMKFPHVWCPGCSNGIVLGAIIRAIDELGLDKDNTALISGIGCSSRMPAYIDLNTLHTLHGRAIAFATGVKMFKPGMNVIVVTGDGDCSAIGGNHLIHAARRNINLTVVLVNNKIYGMTGGQYSPATPHGDKATTMPYGNIDPDFDICGLAQGAGATHVARTSAFHAVELTNMIKQGINHKGFSLVEAVCACPIIYGRLNKKGNAPQMMLEMKNNSVTLAQAEKMSASDLEGKIVRGTLVKNEKKMEYTEAYNELIEKIQPKEGK